MFRLSYADAAQGNYEKRIEAYSLVRRESIGVIDAVMRCKAGGVGDFGRQADQLIREVGDVC